MLLEFLHACSLMKQSKFAVPLLDFSHCCLFFAHIPACACVACVTECWPQRFGGKLERTGRQQRLSNKHMARRRGLCVDTAPAAMASRVKNTASAKDLMRSFRCNYKSLDAQAFMLADVLQIIERHEQLLSDIMRETLRPNQTVLIETIMLAYDDFNKKQSKSIAKQLCSCFSFIRSTSYSASSGKRLQPSLWRLVQQYKSMQGRAAGAGASVERSPPSTPRDQKQQRRSADSVSAASGSTGHADIYAMYGLPAPSAAGNVSTSPPSSENEEEVSGSEREGWQHGEEVDLVSEEEMVDRGYFDPSKGTYVRTLRSGQCEQAVMSEGPDGMCVAQYDGKEAFATEVPNLWLKEKATSKGKKPQKKALATKPKLKKADLAAEAAAEEGPAVEEGPLGAKPLVPAAAAAAVVPPAAGKWQGYSLDGLPSDCRPSESSSGKHSFTVHVNAHISIDVLLRCQAFFVKKPSEARAQYSWKKYSSKAEAWKAAKEAAQEFLEPVTLD